MQMAAILLIAFRIAEAHEQAPDLYCSCYVCMFYYIFNKNHPLPFIATESVILKSGNFSLVQKVDICDEHIDPELLRRVRNDHS